MEWNIHPEAQEEHDDLIEYLMGIDEDVGLAFEACYLERRHGICAFPLHYNLREGGFRSVNLMPRFGEYYIAYMVWNQKVVILAVAHAKRRPLYWRERMEESRRMF